MGHANDFIIEQHPNIQYIGFEDIKKQWLEYQSMSSLTNPEECELYIDYNNDENNINKLSYKTRWNNASKKTFVVILTGLELVKLRQRYRFQLFDRNVRYFLGDSNKINQKIIESALKTPEIFYCFNNGITLTCNQCKEPIYNKKLKLIRPQIINGAQTVNSLFVAYEKMMKQKLKEEGKNQREKAEQLTNEHFDKIKVLCRIVESTIDNDSTFSKLLTKYNNSQNEVKVFDFYANEPVQEKLQQKFADFGYFYERKRGERAYIEKEPHETLKKLAKDFKNWNVKINIQNVASIYQAYLGKPSYAETNPKNIIDSSSKEDYRKIFGNNVSEITDDKIKDMVLAINIYNSVEAQAKQYDKMIKLWSKLSDEPASEKLLNDLKEEFSKIQFLSNQLISGINDCHSYNDIQPIVTDKVINKYFLLSRGRYMLTALIKYIIDENNYYQILLNNGLYSQFEAINNLIVKKWIGTFVREAILPVYNETRKQEKLSEETFYKRIGYFEKIKNKIKDIQYDEDKDLKELFPLRLN